VVNSIYNIVDQIFIGWGVGYLGNAATNVCFPLLIGGPLEEKCDLIIAVFADPKTQEKRLSERGKDPKEALLINKGWPRGAARKKAGLALDGNGSVDELTKQLDKASYL
jgi:dephospho-CoA kinase